ncbi:MAG TPA: hypothetical protein DC063_07765 [Arenimonas sp.]|nr:MAG: hypothetical protein A2X76_03695 [Xanthomonadales bacterium GWF1_69_6]HBD19977.1 hypothetical protein [Arenimonas sp.]
MPRFALLLLLVSLLAPTAPASAQAVYRCVDAQGRSVFSDQPCASQQAHPREAPKPPVASAQGFASGTGTTAPGCARTPQALLDGVRGALEARDVNRLATHYHWAGTGARAGRFLMDELEAIAARPLASAELAWEAPPAGASPGAEPAPPSRLRIEQSGASGAAGAVRTEFLLRRHAGCWWIEL